MTSISIAGNLAADPEIRFTPGGIAVTRLTVIENRRRRTDDGQGWEDSEPHAYRVQVWGSQAENVAESCGKGDRVAGWSVRSSPIDGPTRRAGRVGRHST